MNKKRKVGNLLMLSGALLLAIAVALLGFNYYTELNAGKEAEKVIEHFGAENREEDNVFLPDYVVNPDMEMPVKVIDGKEYVGKIEIPALDLSLPVISQWSYSGSRSAPCRYSGTPYKNNMVIAGHNYRTHFGSLNDLTEGDEIIFTDAENNVFRYKVLYTEILQKRDVEEMKNADCDLTLFTCNYSGNARVTVRCAKEK